MVTLPSDFVATLYPGYFWHVTEKKLYSIKVSGELRQMKLDKGGFFFGQQVEPGYRISVNGRKVRYPMSYLDSLTPTTDIQEIPLAKV